MVTRTHRLQLAAAAVVCGLLLSQCETVRTVKSTRKGSITFDEAKWGGQGAGADTQEIRSKFAERGYKISEEGTIIADKPDLYKGQKPRGLDGDFQRKKARFEKMEAETKAFKTPEYLKRQEFAGVTSARESGMAAREGNSSRSPDQASGKLFDKKARNSSEWSQFGTSTSREAGKVFETAPDVAAGAVAEAPRAVGTPRKAGYQDNVALSMDDVKKMLNPGSYARGTGISD